MRKLASVAILTALAGAACGGGAGAGSGHPASSVETPTGPELPVSTMEAVTTTVPATCADGRDPAEPGIYGVGEVRLDTIDRSRSGRQIRILAYYPAAGVPSEPSTNAPPDRSAAPYPVVVGDAQIGSIVGPHLASHGFVFAGVLSQVSWGMTLSPSMVDYPLDQMAALDAIEALTEGPLVGIADTSRTGVIGYSFGSFDALMLTGARVDSAHHASTCAHRPSEWSGTWWRYICDPAGWDRVEARATEVGIAHGSGLWDPMGDDRIVAAVLGGPEGFDLTGPAGLAEARVPILLLAAGDDDANDYDPATVELFEHYPDARLITFAGAGHMMIFEPDAQAHILRFATAFFGQQLHEIAECGALLTEEFVEETAPDLGEVLSFDTLVWGLLEEG